MFQNPANFGEKALLYVPIGKQLMAAMSSQQSPVLKQNWSQKQVPSAEVHPPPLQHLVKFLLTQDCPGSSSTKENIHVQVLLNVLLNVVWKYFVV